MMGWGGGGGGGGDKGRLCVIKVDNLHHNPMFLMVHNTNERLCVIRADNLHHNLMF